MVTRLFKRLLALTMAIGVIAVTAISGYADDGGLKLPDMEQITGANASTFLPITDEADIEKLSADELMLLLLEMSIKIDADEMDVDAFISVLPAMNSKVFPLITDSDFISIAQNKDYPESFRFLFMDAYPIVTTPNSENYNDALKLIAEDSTESSFIRTNAATGMSDDDKKADVMYALYNDVGDHDKAILMKHLSLIKPAMANELSKKVLNDYKSYDQGLVGLANKTLVRTAQGLEDEKFILQINKELLSRSEDVYTQIALFALSEMENTGAVTMLLQNVIFSDSILQTFQKLLPK